MSDADPHATFGEAARVLNVPDRATYYGGGARGYTDYPALDVGSGTPDQNRRRAS
jgi:hypothetical protein